MKKPNATPQEGIDYVTIGGSKWAKWNVGASRETDNGWYFSWADKEGYIRYADSWQSEKATSFEFSYSPSSVHTAGVSDYLYVKNQTFIISGHSFDWAHTPYHSGSDQNTGWTKYIPTGQSSLWSGTGDPDNKAVLDMEDDAASVNWGGDWRIPTTAEFYALYEACGGTGATYAPLAISSANPGKGIYWLSEGQTYISDYTGVAGLLFCDGTSMLFFPAAGRGSDTGFDTSTGSNYYWAGSLFLGNPISSSRLGFSSSGGTAPGSSSRRCDGYRVRPVLD